MIHTIFSDKAASITDLKKNPMGTVKAAGGPVAILNRNQPVFYCVPAAEYEAMMELLEDMKLNEIADARAGEVGIPVSIDEL
ncbi:MAG: type II toxin-antitoxin system prevent-host-death family antitoxin [Rhodobacteraceae bacterium]|nr:type II toxin-antitoxin system prevent-host-death family antitoxin [Paracoccaceae bacterium]